LARKKLKKFFWIKFNDQDKKLKKKPAKNNGKGKIFSEIELSILGKDKKLSRLSINKNKIVVNIWPNATYKNEGNLKIFIYFLLFKLKSIEGYYWTNKEHGML
jgi:hypothetical protein